MVEPSNIKVQGLNQAVRALRAIGVPSAEIGKASQEAGELVAGRARTLVPVRTGKLRSSIKTLRQSRKVVVKAGNENTIPYANPIHWGWNYDKVNLQAKNIRPRPFFTNALRTTREQVYKTFFDSMERLFQEYSNKP
jgi:HK97 gp10 family phage protein